MQLGGVNAIVDLLKFLLLVISGNSTSCGCYIREVTSTRNLKQHLLGTKETGMLYICRLKNDKEHFLKFGFAEDLETRIQRFHRDEFDFDIQIIHTISGSKPLLLEHEAIVCGRDTTPSPVEHLKYRPNQKFGGYTECFKEEALLDLCEYLDDISSKML